MKPEVKFLNQDKSFWAHVRTISQKTGYTVRRRGLIKIPSHQEMGEVLKGLGLATTHVIDEKENPTVLGVKLLEYFQYRAKVLNEHVEPRLMNLDRVKGEFGRLYEEIRPKCPIPMNKQKKEKRGPAYFTGIINMLIEKCANGLPCDYGPKELTTITRDSKPVRTLARWVDGAFPRAVNPIAVWEIKEYYHTTTFGSRVADGVYETLLDGMELEELREHEGIDVKHYLMVGDHYTWWECGRSYLCRILDMLHMGYVDEVLFGYEVIERLPALVKEWVIAYNQRNNG